MDHCLSFKTPFSFSVCGLQSLCFKGKPSTFSSRSSFLGFPLNFSGYYSRGAGWLSGGRAACVVLAAKSSGECEEFSGLNTPVQPKSAAGRFLSGALLNDPDYFRDVVKTKLEQLVVDRYEALERINLSSSSDEACLHRRIAELKECECQAAVEDVMYMLICSKFYEIRVHLVPRLSKCIYNGRLEIVPSKEWELESIHNFEVLEMVREHLNTFVGWRTNSNVTDKWALTEIPRLRLCQVYTASVLYGYFLKSASVRFILEKMFGINSVLALNVGSYLPISESLSLGSKHTVFGPVMSIQSTSVGEVSCCPGKKLETLRGYIVEFNPETLQRCANPRSKVAATVIERQISELFQDERTGMLKTNEVICTSFASLKRIVLEGIAFGSFLWDAEDFVGSIYKLKDN